MNMENYRRVMSMPLRNVITDNGGARVERGWMTQYPCCTADACEQGDKPCPCPDACVLPQPPEEGPGLLSSRAFWIAAVVLLLAYVVTWWRWG